jgi:hypothetical protein
MKKYLSGLFAIALAIGFSAFTVGSKVKNSSYLLFEFWGDNETQFQTAGKWELDATPEIECDVSVSPKNACLLLVDQTIATTVTNEATLAVYVQGPGIDTFTEIDNAIAQGIDGIQPQQRLD